MKHSRKQVLVSAESVTKEYRTADSTNTPLSNISFDGKAGEMVLLLGPSGSGKSTFLMLLAGLIPPTTGDIILFGKRIVEFSQEDFQSLRSRSIGFVFQNFLLIDWLTAEENIGIVLHFSGNDSDTLRDRTYAMLRKLRIDHLAKKYPSQMSHGEQQRVAIARAFVLEPQLILADEPTAALEFSQGLEVVDMLHAYAKERGSCVVVASHDLRIRPRADRVISIENGHFR